MWDYRRKEASTSPPARYDYHCFISYTSREDEIKKIKPFIDNYVSVLQAQGVTFCPVYYDGWYLRRDHYEDAELQELLRDGIRRSAFSVCFLSPGYYASAWCIYEWLTTEAVHTRRGRPAQEYSILPICWKGVSTFPKLDRLLLESWEAGMTNWASLLQHRDPEHICRFLKAGSIIQRSAALRRCIQRTYEYLNEWYPQEGWGSAGH
jgi:TIR domain